MFKKLFIVVLIATAVLFFTRDLIAKIAVEAGVRFVTGLKLEMGALQTDFTKTTIRIQNLRLFNPSSFPDKIMIDMPEIFVDYNLKDILSGKIHLEELGLELRDFFVIRNQAGALNLDAFKAVKQQNTGSDQSENKAKNQKPPKIQIDKMKLSIGKVTFKDYSKDSERPSVNEFKINMNEEYTDITNPYTIGSIIVVQVMTRTTLATLTDFDVSGLSNATKSVLVSSKKLAEGTVVKTSQTFEGVTDSAADTAKKTASAVTDTASELAGSLKGLFGKKE